MAYYVISLEGWIEPRGAVIEVRGIFCDILNLFRFQNQLNYSKDMKLIPSPVLFDGITVIA